MNSYLSTAVIRALGHYVYAYIDPRDRSVFYVGKGRGSRVLTSLRDSINKSKHKRIAELRRQGLEPTIEVLAHGLPNEKAAFLVEQVAIDLTGLTNLDNVLKGHGSEERGRASLDELITRYDAAEIDITHDVILIRINKLYRFGMSAVDLYDATRGIWKIGLRREKAKYACAVYKGIVKEVYEIEAWYPAGSTFSSRGHLRDSERWEFVGQIAPTRVRTRYLSKSVRKYFKRNSQTPFAYVNCI